MPWPYRITLFGLIKQDLCLRVRWQRSCCSSRHSTSLMTNEAVLERDQKTPSPYHDFISDDATSHVSSQHQHPPTPLQQHPPPSPINFFKFVDSRPTPAWMASWRPWSSLHKEDIFEEKLKKKFLVALFKRNEHNYCKKNNIICKVEQGLVQRQFIIVSPLLGLGIITNMFLLQLTRLFLLMQQFPWKLLLEHSLFTPTRKRCNIFWHLIELNKLCVHFQRVNKLKRLRRQEGLEVKRHSTHS